MATVLYPPNIGIVPSNSTTTPLVASATFTGDWVNVNGRPSIIVALLTDKDGMLYVDFSPDGVNVDSTLEYNVMANINEVHRLTISREFFRIRITNTAATNQTFLRAQTTIGEFNILTSPLNQAVAQDADSLTMRNLDTETSIASGKFSGYSIVNKVGRNPDIDTATVPEDIWGGDGVYTGFPDTDLETIEILSDSVNDTAAGTGARSVNITGLDTNYNVISETVILNGTTPVETIQQFRRAHTMRTVTAGSGGVNAGTITARHSTTEANIFVVMQPGINQTNSSGYTVPAGYTAYMRKLYGAIRGNASGTSVDGGLWTRTFGEVFRQRRPFNVSSGAPWIDNIFGGLVFTEKSDLIIRVTQCSANNTEIVSGYDLILVQN